MENELKELTKGDDNSNSPNPNAGKKVDDRKAKEEDPIYLIDVKL